MFYCWPKYIFRNSYLLSTRMKYSKINDGLFSNVVLLKIRLACMSICNNSNKYDKEQVATVVNMINYWHDLFENEKILEPKQSIEFIMAYVLGISRVTNLMNVRTKELSIEQLQKLENLCFCRLSRMPVQYIIGKWDFRHITLNLEPPIFIPRPETEILVDISLNNIAKMKNEKCNILEIGCGSGAICLSLIHSNKNANVVAIDANSHACELTMKNAQNLQIQDRLTVLNAILKTDGIIYMKKELLHKQPINFQKDKFDIIISNPPYISTKSLFMLQPEIKLYEDIKAYDGGKDGLKLIIPILKYASEALKIGGFLILEVDSNHPEKIQALIEENYVNKFKLEYVHKDFNNKDRVVEISKIA